MLSRAFPWRCAGMIKCKWFHIAINSDLRARCGACAWRACAQTDWCFWMISSNDLIHEESLCPLCLPGWSARHVISGRLSHFLCTAGCTVNSDNQTRTSTTTRPVHVDVRLPVCRPKSGHHPGIADSVLFAFRFPLATKSESNSTNSEKENNPRR